ncbi:MAG: efflux RND transporter periplasmic adaptor subunit [Proteobacteria bacterium]|nr:efflux RND transporter periplasmic adaptor subunit [Pseudomonadota bacterium]
MEKSNSNNSKRLRIIFILLFVFLILGIAWAAWWYFIGQFRVSTNDAYVAGNQVQVTPRTNGTVTKIYADNTQLVHEGQRLVTLDDTDQIINLRQAEAKLAHSVLQVMHMKAEVKKIRYAVQDYRIRFEKAKLDFDRRKGLLATHAISKEQFSHAKDALAMARASLNQSLQALASAQTLVRPGSVYHDPQVKLAIEEVRNAYVNLARTKVDAPVTGVVARRQVQVGQRVSAGMPLMMIIPMNQMWVNANFKENQLANVRVGQPVRLESDLYGGDVIFHGHVEGIDAGTGSAFSILPAQNATGNWIKVVQRVPVRILIDPEQLKRFPLRIGLSMSVTINTHDRTGPLLTSVQSQAPQYATPIFQGTNKTINAVIHAIVNNNLKVEQ